MKKKRIVKCLLIIDLLALIIFIGIFFSGKNDTKVIESEKVVEEPSVEVKSEVSNIQPERELWLNNENINSDYVGELIFDSNLINQPFVQAKTPYDSEGNLYHFYTQNGKLVKDGDGYTGNDVYIWTNWMDMSYDYNIKGGSVFMDYRNDLDDQNIIIYGHHFSVSGGNDVERVKAFTPLEKLLESANFKGNDTLKLVLDNETRYYELVYTFIFDVYDENCINNMQYYRRFYNYDDFNNIKDDNYYSNYISNLEKYELYDTGRSLTTDDKTLTLQTCIGGHDGELYEICVFKQVNIEYFD